MAEILSLYVSLFRVVGGLNSLSGATFPASKQHLKLVLGELKVLRAILVESMVLLQASPSPPPESASVAVERCQELEDELNGKLRYMGFSKVLGEPPVPRRRRLVYQIRRMSHEDELRDILQSFRDAVVLLRDISTE